jgi:hypothetical protein
MVSRKSLSSLGLFGLFLLVIGLWMVLYFGQFGVKACIDWHCIVISFGWVPLVLGIIAIVGEVFI